jgi:protein-disulfide isomerase
MDMAVKYHSKSLVAFMLLGTLLNLAFVSSAKADAEITVSRSLTAISNDDVVIGDREAAVTIVEYFSPTCTHCNVFHQEVFPELKAKYIDTGKIAYVMREFVGNKQDLDASILARCSVDNEGYLKLMEVILSRQEEWAYNKNYRQYLVDIGAQGGITEEQYKKCLAGDSWTEVFIKNAKLAVNTPNFIGTPSFFINGELISVTLSKEQFFLKIDQTYSEMALKTACPECEEVMTYLENITREINNMARG